MQHSAQKLNESELKARIAKYCAYRERSQKETRQRLIELGANYYQADLILVELIENDFINEERFARAVCRGKFLHNKWGKIKIVQMLKQNRISDYCIRKGLQEIAEGDYLETLKGLMEKELEKSAHLNEYRKKHKVARALITKGYEPDLIWSLLGRN